MDSINNACKLGSDAWLELQAFKTRQLNRREKLNRHKNLHKDLINGMTGQSHQQNQASLSSSASTSTSLENAICTSPTANQNLNKDQPSGLNSLSPHLMNLSTNASSSACSTTGLCNTNPGDLISSDGLINNNYVCDKSHESPTFTNNETIDEVSNQFSIDQTINLELVECLLLLKLCDVALKLPIDSKSLQRSICKIRALDNTPLSLIENLLQKFAHQELIIIEETALAMAKRRKKQLISHQSDDFEDDESCIYIKSADHTKLVEFNRSFSSREDIQTLLLESKSDDIMNEEHESVPIQNMRSSTMTNSQHLEKDETTVKDETDYSKDTKILSDNRDTRLPKSKTMQIRSKTANAEFSKTPKNGDDLESLLSLSSTKERESKKIGEELLELLSKPTAKERNLLERFRSADGYQVQEFCPKGTKGECIRNNNGAGHCEKLHFKKIIAKHTEESLGDCSFLNTCFHMDSCKYVHYEVDYGDKISQHPFKRPNPAEPTSKLRRDNPDVTKSTNHNLLDFNKSSISTSDAMAMATATSSSGPFQYKLSSEEQARIDAKNRKRFKTVLYPPQWIQCDLRFFDMSLLGKFSVVMADPPWDIHMELPYGTMSDDEMRKLNIPALQDEGVIFLWVTGRAMELGRECLALWGYERCDEIIWVKTNQLQRIIRTGRTGHWLNHGKEHCLVGVKGKPKNMNRGLDCDVIVAEVRATSHKPDEIYGIIERLSPGTRKIELFGRAHNVQPNWITLGNQLNGVKLIEPNLISAFKKLNLPFQTADD